MAEQTQEPKFKVGQVVRMDTEWYRAKEKKAEQYQRIKKVWLWNRRSKGTPRFGYDLVNGDSCNEKWLKPLTSRESGVRRG